MFFNKYFQDLIKAYLRAYFRTFTGIFKGIFSNFSQHYNTGSTYKLIDSTGLTDQNNYSISSQRQRRVPINLYRNNILLDDANVLGSTVEIYSNFQLFCIAIDSTIAEFNSRFTERNLAIVSAALCLLFKRTHTLHTCKILASLLTTKSGSSAVSNIEGELMVLHDGLLRDEYLSLSDLAECFSKTSFSISIFYFCS